MGFLLPYALLILSTVTTAQLVQPWPARWSNSYGPDGPWNTVRVAFGSPPQEFDALPAGQWNSWFLRKDICKNALPSGTCFAQNAGTYDQNSSKTYVNTSQVYKAVYQDLFEPSEFTFGDYEAALDLLSLPSGRAGIKDVQIQNHTSYIVENAYRILPNGTQYSINLGTLSLGGPDTFQNLFVDGHQLDGQLVSNDMKKQGITPSNSYGLHIGSPTVKLGGSLLFGGYDRFRVVGPTSAQEYAVDTLPIALLDIGVGVATGSSPFNFTSRTGLLGEGNSSFTGVTALKVDIEGRHPYLYLPQSTCDAISRFLPVRYSPDLGLYLWLTEDPNYKRIIFSPAYLSFTFRANNTVTQNITIKVPFRLLSLTLTEPLATVPTQYFPCTTPRVPSYRLGRAFMQAAFVSVNWMENSKGVWILAQAPGPNLPESPDVTTIGAEDRALAASDTSWELSWQGVWAPIAADDSPQDTKPRPNSTSDDVGTTTPLPTALIVGSSVGALVLVCGTIVAIFYFMRRDRRRKLLVSMIQNPRRWTTTIREIALKDAGWGPRELPARNSLMEMPLIPLELPAATLKRSKF
jgi:hypothetical protein